MHISNDTKFKIYECLNLLRNNQGIGYSTERMRNVYSNHASFFFLKVCDHLIDTSTVLDLNEKIVAWR
jgi:hypothetical protein